MRRFVAFVYKNARSYNPNGSHIGLGVNALHSVRVLQRHGVACGSYGANDGASLTQLLLTLPKDSVVILEAPWVQTKDINLILQAFPHIQLVVRCHSQIAFLQADVAAVKLVREQLEVAEMSHHFQMAGNSKRFTNFIEQAYRSHCQYLPNLYDNLRVSTKLQKPHNHRVLRVGSFGAMRPFKFHNVSAASAIMAARKRGNDLEFHVSAGRIDGGRSVLEMIRQMFHGLPGATLVEDDWYPWAQFRQLVAHMDICLQMSTTESFNITIADAAAEGVPIVVGPAIDWVPDHCQSHCDDPNAVANTMLRVLSDPTAAQHNFEALEDYCAKSIETWLKYLKQMDDVPVPRTAL